jgi:hypothetical protein
VNTPQELVPPADPWQISLSYTHEHPWWYTANDELMTWHVSADTGDDSGPGAGSHVGDLDITLQAAATYAGCLAADAACADRASVPGSLLHMHHVRAHGISPGSEQLCHRLARAVALAWTARHQEAAGDRR